MTTYRKDADVGEQLGVISQLRYSLPDIAQFDSQAGIKAVIDARRRHKSWAIIGCAKRARKLCGAFLSKIVSIRAKVALALACALCICNLTNQLK